MDQDSRKIRKISGGIQPDVLRKEDIFWMECRNGKFRKPDRIVKLFCDYFLESGKEITKRLTYRLILRILSSFFDTLLEKVIMDNCVFEFPYGAGYIFVAQRPLESKAYRYSMKTGTGYYAIYFVFGRYFKSTVLLQLRKPWRQKFIQEIKNGHKYDSYELIINKIKARHARKLSIPASKIHLRGTVQEIQVEVPEHV
jgi:hypothetical protein